MRHEGKKKRIIGFTQGVAFAAALMKTYHMDAEGLIKESGIPTGDFWKYADESDLERIISILDSQDTKK